MDGEKRIAEIKTQIEQKDTEIRTLHENMMKTKQGQGVKAESIHSFASEGDKLEKELMKLFNELFELASTNINQKST